MWYVLLCQLRGPRNVYRSIIKIVSSSLFLKSFSVEIKPGFIEAMIDCRAAAEYIPDELGAFLSVRKQVIKKQTALAVYSVIEHLLAFMRL
jgi:hypothetical protein